MRHIFGHKSKTISTDIRFGLVMLLSTFLPTTVFSGFPFYYGAMNGTYENDITNQGLQGGDLCFTNSYDKNKLYHIVECNCSMHGDTITMFDSYTLCSTESTPETLQACKFEGSGTYYPYENENLDGITTHAYCINKNDLNEGVCKFCTCGDVNDPITVTDWSPYTSAHSVYRDTATLTATGEDYVYENFGENYSTICNEQRVREYGCEAGYYIKSQDGVDIACAECPSQTCDDKITYASCYPPNAETGQVMVTQPCTKKGVSNVGTAKSQADCWLSDPVYGNKSYGTCQVTKCKAGHHPNADNTECVLNTYSVTFGNGDKTASYGDAKYGDTFPLYCTPSKYGKDAITSLFSGDTIVGWTIGTDGSNLGCNDDGTTNSITIETATTLYPVWAPKYTLTLSPGTDATGTAVQHTGVSGTTVTLTCDQEFSRTGYSNIIGWSTTDNSTSATYNCGASYTITTDATLYAVWQPLLTITYNNADGTATPKTHTNITHGSTVKLDCDTYGFPVDDKKQSGWSTTPNNGGDRFTCGNEITLTNNLTLYASYIPMYTITYLAGTNGTGETKTETAPQGTSVALLECGGDYEPFTRPGYYQYAWTTTDGGSYVYSCSSQSITSITLTGDITLYPVWGLRGYGIWYECTDCTGDEPDLHITTYTEGAAAPENTFKKDGNTFLGWACELCDDRNCTSTSTPCHGYTEAFPAGTLLDPYSLGDDIMLIAKWDNCPAGYYCPTGEPKKECPIGSTSNVGATAITDCYLAADQTQICGNNGCITLPVDIKYQ